MAIDWLYNPYAILFVVFWLLWSIYFVVNVRMFFVHRNSFYIKTRSPWLIFSSACGQYLMITSQSWKIIVGPQNFPNFIDLWFLWFLIPLHFVPYPVRSLQYIIKYHVGKAYADKQEAEDNEVEGGYSTFWIKVSEKQEFVSDNAFLGYSLCLVGITAIIGLVRLFKYPENMPGHNGSGIQEASYISSAAMIAFVSLFLWLGYYFLQNVHDEIAINTELLAIGLTWIFCVPFFVGFGLGNLSNPKIPPEISPIFDVVLCIISFMVSFAMPVSLATFKNPDFKLTIPKFRNVDAVLADPVAYRILRNFMQKNACIESLLFLRDATRFQELTDPQMILTTAKKLYDKYIPLKSPLEINISSKLKDNIKVHLTECTPTLFDDAIREVKKVINQDQLPSFMSSFDMSQYVKTLRVNAIQDETE